MPHFLHTNLRRLREIRKCSQDIVAGAINVKRSTYAGWETGVSEPCIDHLLALRAYHRLAIDVLVGIDLIAWPYSNIELAQRQFAFTKAA